MSQSKVATSHKTDPKGMVDTSVLMQIRAQALRDLQRRIPVEYFGSRALSKKLVIYEFDDMDRLCHLARVDFNLAKELVEANDRYPSFTSREVSATEVLNAVAYYLMFVGFDVDQLTPHRLARRNIAESKLCAALSIYAHHLDETELRVINVALDVSTKAAVIKPQASLTLDENLESEAAFEPVDELDHAPKGDDQVNFDLLATRAQLLSAFGAWGLKENWFSELSSHSWLKVARRIKGKGQRGHLVEPLFCPLAVMNGLVTSIRGRARLRQNKGWDVLERHFPSVSRANSVVDPRDQTG